MARPRKTGLDYFPVDIDMDQDDKIYMIEAELGEIAFGRLMKLLMEIYRNGYYKPWSEQDILVFSGKKKIPLEEVRELVTAAVTAVFFEKTLVNSEKILTSAGIQRRYIQACASRETIIIDSRYCLVDPSEFPSRVSSKITIVNGEETPLNQEETPVTDVPSTQSIGQHSIEEKSKAERARAREEAAAASATAPTQEQRNPASEHSGTMQLPSAATPLNLDTLSTRLNGSGFGISPPVVTDIFRGLQRKGEGWEFLEFVMTKAAGKDSGRREGFLIWAIVKEDSVHRQWKLERPPPVVEKPGHACPLCGIALSEVSGIFACPKCHGRWELEDGELVEFDRSGPEVLPEQPEEEEVVF